MNETLRDYQFKDKYWTNSSSDSAIDTFYIPALERARSYDRLAGFFSSSSLALTARGVASLIANGGTMRLVCSPILSVYDIDVLRRVLNGEDDDECASFVEQAFVPTISSIERDHLSALAWMVKEKVLQIKLAVVVDTAGNIKPEALFHEKVGIVKDADGNVISFSGSNNETINGWIENQEEFKVFRSWEDGQRRYVQSDEDAFDDYWNGVKSGVRCFDLPIAFEKRLVKESAEFSKEKYISKYYLRRRRSQKAWDKLNLFDYQKSAIKKWNDNGRSLLFEMATGAGKTRCAIGCINCAIETAENKDICIIIAVPTNDLCSQWEHEIAGCIVEDFRLFVANSRPGHEEWRSKIASHFSQMLLHTAATRVSIILTTHATASSNAFIEIANSISKIAKTFIVADEVHGMGAAEHKKGLLDCYDFRLGLSATPERMFDDSGTEFIRRYFGNDKYEFTLRDALKHNRVCPYFYYPIIVELTEEENERYCALSERIRKLSGPAKSDPGGDADERLKQLLIDRAKIVAAAEGKVPALEKLLNENASRWRSHVLAFACDRNFDECFRSMINCGLCVSPYTFKQKDRDRILKKFENGDFVALLAMKCLDEGIDVPDAHVAILISSSTNPREYIQRIGRVIRKSSNKSNAEIYDFLVVANTKLKCDDIIERDFRRGAYIAEAASNAFEASEILFSHTRKGGI